MFKKILEDVRESIVDMATDPYEGANWAAEWRVTDTELGEWSDVNEVIEAVFVGASGGIHELRELGFGHDLRRKLSAETVDAMGVAIAQALRRKKWRAKAWFGWTQDEADFELSDASIGDTFNSHSDTFSRWGVRNTIEHLDNAYGEEVPVTITVTHIRYNKRGRAFEVDADFTA
jgi:hypothetical protein